MPGVVIVGAGPGIGLAVARRFAREGLPVVLIARSTGALAAARGELEVLGAQVSTLQADVTDVSGLRSTLGRLVANNGVPDVVVYNAALIRSDTVTSLTDHELLRSFAVNVVGAVVTAAELLPQMAERGSGTMILTGGMPDALPSVVSLSIGKAGVRALTDLLAAQFGPAGVHVSTVTIYGAVAPGTEFDPDEIAEEYWQIHQERPSSWRVQVDYAGKHRS